MEHKEQLEKLHKEALAKADEYLKTKEGLKDGDKEKFHAAKKNGSRAGINF